MKIYTRKGDNGQTYCGGEYISKSETLVDVIGDLDELSSVLGLCKIANNTDEYERFFGGYKSFIESIQSDLLKIGAELGTVNSKIKLYDGKILVIEDLLDLIESELPELKDFILPGDGVFPGYLHLARSVCRRLERKMVKLNYVQEIRGPILPYINRLSDLFFVMARFFAVEEVIWQNLRGYEYGRIKKI